MCNETPDKLAKKTNEESKILEEKYVEMEEMMKKMIKMQKELDDLETSANHEKLSKQLEKKLEQRDAEIKEKDKIIEKMTMDMNLAIEKNQQKIDDWMKKLEPIEKFEKVKKQLDLKIKELSEVEYKYKYQSDWMELWITANDEMINQAWNTHLKLIVDNRMRFEADELKLKEMRGKFMEEEILRDVLRAEHKKKVQKIRQLFIETNVL